MSHRAIELQLQKVYVCGVQQAQSDPNSLANAGPKNDQISYDV